MTTYVLKSAASDLTGGNDFNKVLSPGTETAGSITVSVAASATEDSFGYSQAENPDTDGATGNYTVEMNVLGLGNALFDLSAAVARVNSAGVQQAISAFAATQLGTAGAKTFSLTGADLGTWAAGDRLKVVYRFKNNAVVTGSIEIETGTAATEVVAPWTLSPRFSSASAGDGQRDWDAPYQDLTVIFDQAVQDPALSVGGAASGHTIKIGGAAQTTTYRAGSGTATWTLRVTALLRNGNTLSWSYDRAAGATVSVATGREQLAATDKLVTNNLTKRVRAKLRGKNDAVVASESVSMSVHSYGTGSPANAAWMSREQKATVATDAAGLIDVQYTGAAAPLDAVYVAVIRTNVTPTETMLSEQSVD